MTEIPSAYVEGYEKKVLPRDKAAADNYIKHTMIGDPVMDEIMEELSSLPPRNLHRFVEAGIEQQDETLAIAPKILRDFFNNFEEPPWLDYKAFQPGIRSFNVNVDLMLTAFVTGVLVEGFSTLIAKSFSITGRVAMTKRRLQQNNRHMMEIFFPGGMLRNGDGWKLSMRNRFIHARIRHLLNKSGDWDHGAWGAPVSAAHLGFAISVFSMRLLEYSMAMGARYNKEEQESVLAIWRYAGYIMGIPETILYTTGAEAQKIYEIGYMCEPRADADSVAVANTLITAIPIVAGVTDPDEQKELTNLAYRLSRSLIGKDLAEQFEFPRFSFFENATTLFSFRLKQRIQRFLKNKQFVRSQNFSQLIQISVYDEGGLSYKMPDHVHTAESSDW